MNKKTRAAQLFAIFTGTLTQGFSVAAIVPAAGVDAAIKALHQAAVESIPVQDPAGEVAEFQADPSGTTVVFLGNLYGGELFGPFSNENSADCFAGSATADSDNADYQIFTIAAG